MTHVNVCLYTIGSSSRPTAPPRGGGRSHAPDLASVHDADVHALYVVDTASYAGMPMETSWGGSATFCGTMRTRRSRRSNLAAETDLHVETGVAEGSPSKEIIRYAEDNGCDLIVMGTHGRSGRDRPAPPRERRREGGPRVERSRVDGAAGR